MNLFRIACWAALLTGVLEFSAAAESHPEPRRANIILIVADSLGAGDLSCYGQTQFQTPHLDELAAGGIRFTNYLAGGFAAPPARAALLLGRDTSRLPNAEFSLASGDTTIANLLQSSGYGTCLIGEWDLGDERSAGAPWLQGFHEFAGYFDPADWQNVYPDYLWKYDETIRPSEDRPVVFNGREMLYYNTGGRKGQYVPDSFAQWAINFARNHKPDQFNDHRPFFLVLDETIPGSGDRQVPTQAPFSDEPWPPAERDRAATIARLDDDIGKLVNELGTLGEASNTVIFFTSDTVPKKDGNVDPKFFHENSGPDDLRVPLIVSWPGTIPGGQVSGLKCSARDFLPTAAAIALVKTPANVNGVSLLPAMLGRR